MKVKVIVYKLIGTFGKGDSIMDFVPLQHNNDPCVTIKENSAFVGIRSETVKAPDGWHDVTVNTLGENLAKAILAEINNVSPNSIIILETGASAYATT